jgi:hypothetical protein
MDEAVRSLAAIMRNADAPPRARIQAADILLDRGWGKPEQTHTGSDDDGDIHVTIRHIVNERDVPAGKVIEAHSVRAIGNGGDDKP